MTDWMPFLTPAVLGAPATTDNSIESSVSGSVNSRPTAPVAAAIAPPAPIPVAPQLPTLPTETIAPAPSSSPPATPAPSTRFPRWLPIALLFTAGFAGLSGAAIGWKFRSGAASTSAPALFSREQAFPEKDRLAGRRSVCRQRQR
ncbi:MAG: hypothetical protein HC895_21065 [Leptolyngbyaceae cyanobacterium SM1_3_5]|nr:hypothetical protein [Leptolyngbyaceae cyanobacterium SM1_3_5]